MCRSSSQKSGVLDDGACQETFERNASQAGLATKSPIVAFPSIIQILLWSALTYVSKEFSVFLPVFQSKAGANTFLSTAFKYDEDTYFDNSIWTYGTDYALCAIMSYAAYQCLNVSPVRTYSSNGMEERNELFDTTKSQPLRIKSACLFLSYAISVLAGGYAHQSFTGGVDDLNTIHFRICWTICVGAVSAAGGLMGACGSEIYKRFHIHGNPGRSRFRFFYVHDFLWIVYGGYLTWVCVQGGLSYKRPACDIFVAGTSQFFPTVYCVLTVLSINWNDAKPHLEGDCNIQGDGDRISRKYRYMFYLGFFLNAPLLPTYPLYVQYTSLSLGIVNTIMHTNLLVAWGLQALSLRHFCESFSYNGNSVRNARKDT